MIVRRLCCGILAWSLPAFAAAAEPNPAVTACAGKAEGAPCSHERIVQVDGRATPKNEPGTCQPDECCTLDYSSGPPPKSNCAPCLACKGGVAASDGGDAVDPTGVEPPRAEGGNPPAVEPNPKRGCTIVDGDEPALALGLLVAVVFGVRRRRSG